MAKQIYIQRMRLPIPKSEISNLIKECFKEAEQFVEEANKIQGPASIEYQIRDVQGPAQPYPSNPQAWYSKTTLGLEESQPAKGFEEFYEGVKMVDPEQFIIQPASKPVDIAGTGTYDATGLPIVTINYTKQ